MGRITVALVVSSWVIPISIMVNKIVPDPYMDEIFHIPQAQQYCRGDFKTWDPMITTPPGLYYLSVAYVASLFPGMRFANAVQSLPELCSTAFLRSTNAFLAIICSVLVYDLLINLRPSPGERKSTNYAIVIALYPVHWFFTFLYYTDIASVVAVLAMLLACLKKQYWFSAMLGALAILFRQTNVVWMMFVAANGAIQFAEELYPRYLDKSVDCKMKLDKNDLTDRKSICTEPTLRRRKMDNATSSTNLSNSEMIEKPSDISGAKEAHVVSPHFAQMMYFAVVSAAALAPCHFSLAQAATLFQLLGRNKMRSFVIVLMAFYIGYCSAPIQHSPSISSCRQPALSLLHMEKSHPSSLDDEIPSRPSLHLFMDLHHSRTR